jgi:hypothetical protein
MLTVYPLSSCNAGLPPDADELAAGISTDATGIASLQSGLETPDVALNLRKSGDSVAGTESAAAPTLYTVLEQRKASVGAGLLGTDHTYVIPDAAVAGKKRCAHSKRHLPGGPGIVCVVCRHPGGF